MAKINYQDKVALNPLPSIPNENKVTDADMNEIKASVNHLYDNPEIEVGTTTVTSGTDQCVLFQSGGVVQQSTVFKFDPATGRFNINNVASPTAQINAKATSILSSDYFIRLLDPTESYDIFSMSNDGTIKSRSDTAMSEWYLANGNIATQVGISGGRGYISVPGSFVASNNASNNVASAAVNGNTKAKFYIGAASGNSGLPNEASSNIMFIRTGVNPALNWATGYQQYSSDNGTFHFPAFRLSDGKVVKLEPFAASSITNHADLVNALTTMGILY